MSDPREMIPMLEFSSIFHCSPKVIRTMIAKRRLAAVKIGKEWRIPQTEVDRLYLAAKPATPAWVSPSIRALPAALEPELPPLDPRDRAALQRQLKRKA